jgi:osmotically inducible protein OsmC
MRIAHATWTGTLQAGTGTFNGDSGLSGNYSFASRFQNGTGSTPEELLAAAQAACFSMALEVALEQNGTPATDIHTDATCSITKQDDGFAITLMQLRVRATVANLDNDRFVSFAQATLKQCPVSKALTGIPEATLDAALATAGGEAGAFPKSHP